MANDESTPSLAVSVPCLALFMQMMPIHRGRVWVAQINIIFNGADWTQRNARSNGRRSTKSTATAWVVVEAMAEPSSSTDGVARGPAKTVGRNNAWK